MKEKEKKQVMNWKKEIWEWVKVFLTAALIAFVFNTFIIANSNVPSESMEKTIMTGDRILGFRHAYALAEPQRGDIVIFDHQTGPGNGKTRLVKRIIGLPGETIDIKDGLVYINGSEIPLEESYLPEPMETKEFHVEVAEGCYFMMGDNRNHSVDGRNWSEHNVPKAEIIAKVYWRYFPNVRKLQ